MDRKSFLKSSTASALGITGLTSGGLAMNLQESLSRPSNLKITDIRGCVLATHFPNPIIRITTNQDVFGLGEVRDYGWLGSALMMKPYLVGRNPMDIHSILAGIRHLSGHGRLAGGYCAVETALMDLIGKVLGEPCWKLLDMGRRQRDEIPIYAACGWIRDTPRFRHFMEQRVQKGYTSYKFNVSRLDNVDGGRSGGLHTEKGLAFWGEEVLKMREFIGYKVDLGAQAFGYQTAESAIELGRFMSRAPYSMAYLQSLINFERFNSVGLNRRIAENSPTPNQGGINIFGLESYAPFIEAGSFNLIHPDPRSSGGMMETRDISEYAHRHGIVTMLHAAPSPVGMIADAHLSATIRSFYTLEYQFRWEYMPWWDDLVSGIPKPVIQKGGVIPVPGGPGLGIEFNEEVAEKHLMESEYLPFDTGLFGPTPEVFDRPMTMLEAKRKGLIDYSHDTGFSWWHYNEEMEYGLNPRGM